MTDKIYKMTIELLIISDNNPDTWEPSALGHHLIDHPELALNCTSEVATFASETRPPILQTVPEVAQVSDRESTEYGVYRSGRRRARRRNAAEVEYCYRSHDYISCSKRLEVGKRTTRNKKPCVWLTKDEAHQVNVAVMKRRAKRAARRVAKGGE